MSAGVTPAEARFAATAMACLTLLALLVAGMVYHAEQGLAQPALFVGLALLGAWQVVYFHRIGREQ